MYLYRYKYIYIYIYYIHKYQPGDSYHYWENSYDKEDKNDIDDNGGIEGGDCLYNPFVLLRREKDQHHQQR